MNHTEDEWKELKKNLEEKFQAPLDMDGIIFLIGVQELGKGFVKLKKDEKIEVMHVAVCTLLEPYGFYEFEGRDEDGWPHFKRTAKLPFLAAEQQEQLMKEAILDYFKGEE